MFDNNKTTIFLIFDLATSKHSLGCSVIMIVMISRCNDNYNNNNYNNNSENNSNINICIIRCMYMHFYAYLLVCRYCFVMVLS